MPHKPARLKINQNKKMQAIITKYIGATNSKGSRIKAKCERGSVTIPYPHELSGDAVHRHAARALISKFIKEDQKEYGTPLNENPWMRDFVTGQLPSGEYVHVYTRSN